MNQTVVRGRAEAERVAISTFFFLLFSFFQYKAQMNQNDRKIGFGG